MTKKSVTALAAAVAATLTLALAGPGAASPPQRKAVPAAQAGTPVSTDWPSFGHDLANTRSADEWLLSTANVARLNEKWSAAGAAVTSTPAVVDDVVYYSDFAGNLTARKAGSGATVWQTKLNPAQLPGSPAVVGDTVYIAGYGGMVYAVDKKTGAKKWGAGIESTPNALVWSSPVIAGDTLVIGSASFQVFTPASPPFQGSVVGLDIATGRVKWRTPVCTADCTGVSVWSSAAVDTSLGLAYIGTGQSYSAPAGPMSDSLVALDYRTGKIAWHHQYTADDVFSDASPYGKDADLGAAPNLFNVNGRRVVGSGDKGGSYKAFDARTGAPVWSRNLVKGTQLGGIEHTTAYADGTIYAVGNTEATATSRADARPTAATLFALNATTGATKWQADLPEGGFGGVAIANGVLYFTTWEGTLRAHSAATGRTLFTKYIGTPDGATAIEKGAAGGPTVSGGRVYVGYGWTWGAIAPGGIRSLGLY
ncbi:outer membrane protein assembly factor BamB family protein [Streptomyces beijiangensis]|uniref:PQQ-binding-like beta-propeller repeat protein n=1 Tax=Streptomyces beijiangensis TaxID=163361 RepID=A0A939JJ55_9ACTN|nr:PQQ-binding-like beta-propeller repeat protein [Streptomyces beijiangensis]MBO0513289.1 PQQ-binding-like beta-propeller repeat protein [Streptomyces beijiangensis]